MTAEIARLPSADERKCKCCGVSKPTTEFTRDYRHKERRTNECLICGRSRRAKWKRENPEKVRAARKRWEIGNPVSAAAAYKRWYKNNRDKQKGYWQKRALKKRYGLTEAQYQELLHRQDGRCGICGGLAASAAKRRFAVDHNHLTGQVRGLLCGNCNMGIGNLRESVDVMRLAIAYLEKHK